MIAIMLCGEGPHDIGIKEWDKNSGEHIWREGWLQPIVRKAADSELEIKTRYLKQLVLFPRPKTLKPIPKGQSDKAAFARLIARIEGCDIVVFMTDADTNDEKERSEKRSEIYDGFKIIDNSVDGVACVPRSTSESWLLSDFEAWKALGLSKDCNFPKTCPEDLWGKRDDPEGNHPKHAFQRVSNDAGLDDNRETRRIVCESSSIEVMKKRCPTSLVEFITDLTSAISSNK